MCKYNIEINISEKILRVLDENGVAARYPVICGRNSHLGPKEFEGDERTPRGDYYICTVNRNSKFHIFWGLSYPGPEEAGLAFERDRIGRDSLREILEAHKKGVRPPWDTHLGGEIGIHGGGIDRDGTRGCIGMRDEDVEDLDKYISIGSPVRIE